MRWTKEAEDTLWQTVFKTHSFHIDLDSISKEWPDDDKPTPKALKEHLTKYRKNLGGESKITFGMSAKTASSGGSPRKPAAAARAGAGTGAGVTKGSGKAKGKGKGKAKAEAPTKSEGTSKPGEDEESPLTTEDDSDDVHQQIPKRLKIEEPDLRD